MLLLNTKLNVPPVRPSHVQRIELVQKLNKLRDYKLTLIVDKGKAVNILLDNQPRLETVLFPPACPDLNPQEHVWSQARATVSHNHTYSTFQQLKQAFLNFLSSTLFRFDWLAKYAPAILFDV
jgi:transposase